MIPLATFGSESVAADLLQQVRWRDGVECPRCRSDRTIRYGSYGEYQRYRCKNCARTFNDETGTIFSHSKLGLEEELFAIYAFLRFNVSLRQIRTELDVTYGAIYRRVEREAVVHSDGEYVDGDAHANTCESHRRTSDAWLSPPIAASRRAS